MPDGFAAFPVQEDAAGAAAVSLEKLPSFRKELLGLLGGLEAHLGGAVRAGGFKVVVDASGATLGAALPGYQLSPGSVAPPDGVGRHALEVQVIGRSLVIKGQKSAAEADSSFQRSFAMPAGADADRIAATYNHTDGALAISIPPVLAARDGEPGSNPAEWSFGPQLSGSHTTVALMFGNLAPLQQGEPPSVVDELLDALRRTVGPILDLFGSGGPADEQTSEGSAPRGSASTTTVRVTDPAAEAREPSDAQPPEVPPPLRPTLLVQPMGAKPFWRLGGATAEPGTAILEIVVPRGASWATGGKSVPTYPGPNLAPAAGQIELPVVVANDKCLPADTTTSHERVLRCTIPRSDVRHISIRVAPEL